MSDPFGQKIVFQLQYPEFFVQLIDDGLMVSFGLLAFIEEDSKPVEKRLFQVIDQRGMHFELGRQIRGGIFIIDGGKRHFGLKFRTVLLLLPAHGQRLSVK